MKEYETTTTWLVHIGPCWSKAGHKETFFPLNQSESGSRKKLRRSRLNFSNGFGNTKEEVNYQQAWNLERPSPNPTSRPVLKTCPWPFICVWLCMYIIYVIAENGNLVPRGEECQDQVSGPYRPKMDFCIIPSFGYRRPWPFTPKLPMVQWPWPAVQRMTPCNHQPTGSLNATQLTCSIFAWQTCWSFCWTQTFSGLSSTPPPLPNMAARTGAAEDPLGRQSICQAGYDCAVT